MVLRINPKLKHINCAQFHELMVPVLRKGGYHRKDYEVVSLFREPVEWLESWWRYRKRPALSEENSRPVHRRPELRGVHDRLPRAEDEGARAAGPLHRHE